MKIQKEWLKENGKYGCPYCGKEYPKKGISTHIFRKHTDIGLSMKSNFIEYNKHKDGSPGTNQHIKAKADGKEIIVSEETKRKISKASKGRILTEEHRSAISKGMQKAVKENPESYSSKNVCGRNKRYNLVKGEEEIILHSSWELNVVTALENSDIKWKRVIDEEILYEWNNSTHRYFPDFHLIDYDKYIEVKGYIYDEEREQSKKESLGDRLIIIDGDSIKKIKSGDYSPILDMLQ